MRVKLQMCIDRNGGPIKIYAPYKHFLNWNE